jgi:hypothetical protein
VLQNGLINLSTKENREDEKESNDNLSGFQVIFLIRIMLGLNFRSSFDIAVSLHTGQAGA